MKSFFKELLEAHKWEPVAILFSFIGLFIVMDNMGLFYDAYDPWVVNKEWSGVKFRVFTVLAITSYLVFLAINYVSVSRWSRFDEQKAFHLVKKNFHDMGLNVSFDKVLIERFESKKCVELHVPISRSLALTFSFDSDYSFKLSESPLDSFRKRALQQKNIKTVNFVMEWEQDIHLPLLFTFSK